jgi:hypothetical protein
VLTIISAPTTAFKYSSARAHRTEQQVEGLREFREIAGKAQAEIVATPNIEQPSVSKIERQTDIYYLSTLCSYVEAVGGKLELTVRLPDTSDSDASYAR